MNPTLMVGLIGVGRWGKNIARTLREEVTGITLHRAASRNAEARERVGPACTLHKDWREMLTCDDLDAVFLAVPPGLNREIAGAAIVQRLPVFMEKPMTLNVADAQEILDLAIRHEGIADVDHVDLYNPAVCAMREAVHTPIKRIFGRIGAAYERRIDMSPLWEYLPHFLAVTIALMGRTPDAVKATFIPRETEPFDDPSKEVVRVTMDFSNGAEVCIEAGNGMARKVRDMEVYLDDSVFHFSDRASVSLSSSLLADPDIRTQVPVSSILPLTAAIKAFELKVRLGKPDIEGVIMGLKVVRILEAVTKSLVTKDWYGVK